jgi:geranylgeranyl pyrophosphate synthase
VKNGAHPFDLGGFLATERKRIEDTLADVLVSLEEKVPRSYRPALRHGVLSGGKRLRPILCVAAFRATGGTHPGIYGLAASLELIHAYSLMHDDLPCMDDADLRRGEPTTHRAHGERPAVLAGAFLIPLAANQAWTSATMMGLAPEAGRAVVTELTRAAGGGGMVGGQVLDLLGEKRSLSPAELDDLHRRKTGALLRAALRIGAIAAGAEKGPLMALDAYGSAIGLAFQIADDLLDATSDPQVLGKNPSDSEMGKSTYVTLFGLEEAAARADGLVKEGLDALRRGEVVSPALEALARYIVDRRR